MAESALQIWLKQLEETVRNNLPTEELVNSLQHHGITDPISPASSFTAEEYRDTVINPLYNALPGPDQQIVKKGALKRVFELANLYKQSYDQNRNPAPMQIIQQKPHEELLPGNQIQLLKQECHTTTTISFVGRMQPDEKCISVVYKAIQDHQLTAWDLCAKNSPIKRWHESMQAVPQYGEQPVRFVAKWLKKLDTLLDALLLAGAAEWKPPVETDGSVTKEFTNMFSSPDDVKPHRYIGLDTLREWKSNVMTYAANLEGSHNPLTPEQVVQGELEMRKHIEVLVHDTKCSLQLAMRRVLDTDNELAEMLKKNSHTGGSAYGSGHGSTNQQVVPTNRTQPAQVQQSMMPHIMQGMPGMQPGMMMGMPGMQPGMMQMPMQGMMQMQQVQQDQPQQRSRKRLRERIDRNTATRDNLHRRAQSPQKGGGRSSGSGRKDKPPLQGYKWRHNDKTTDKARTICRDYNRGLCERGTSCTHLHICNVRNHDGTTCMGTHRNIDHA